MERKREGRGDRSSQEACGISVEVVEGAGMGLVM